MSLPRRMQVRRNLQAAFQMRSARRLEDENDKNTTGFVVIFEDGSQIKHAGGLASLSHELIEQHGKVIRSEVLGSSTAPASYPCSHRSSKDCLTEVSGEIVPPAGFIPSEWMNKKEVKT